MQELRKTLRKVAAIGTSVAMLGMTITGALAADYTLADYPKPFDGTNTLIVVGKDAATADSTAATEIGLGLPKPTTSSDTTTSTSNAGTVELDQKFSKDILMGTALSDSSTAYGSEVRDTTLAGLKNKQVLISIDTVSNTYDTHEKMNFTDNAFLATGLTMGQLNTSGEKYGDNILLRFGQASMGYYYVFDADLKSGNAITNATTTYPIQLDFLGKTLEINGYSGTTAVTAIAGDKFNMEVYDSVVVNGKKVSVEAIGGTNSKVCVDGQCDTIGNNIIKTVNGLSIRAQDIIDVGASVSGGKSSVTLVIADAVKSPALKTYTSGDYYIGQDKNNPLWVWRLASLSSIGTTRPLIGVELGQSLTSTSLSIPDYPLSHPPYVGDLLCLPNNYACVTIESVQQNDDDAGLYEIKPEIKTLYASDTTTVLRTDAHVLQITSKSTTAGTGLKDAANAGTSEIYIDTTGGTSMNQAVDIYKKDTTTSRPVLVANNTIANASCATVVYGKGCDGFGMTQINLGTVDYKSTSIPLRLYVFNNTNQNEATVAAPANANTFMTTGITNLSGYVQFKLIVNSTATQDQLQLYFRQPAAGTSQINYLGHRPNGGTYQSNDVLYVPSGGGNVLDVSAYTGNTRAKLGYIVESPKTGIEGDMFRIRVPKDITNYKAKVTVATTKGGAKATVVKGTVSSGTASVLDTEVVGADATYKLADYNVIVVGGPAINQLTAQLLGKEYPAYGANSGLSEGQAVIELKKNNGNYALLVYGWEADDTRRAGLVMKNYADFATQFKDKTSVAVKGTGLEVSGITVE